MHSICRCTEREHDDVLSACQLTLKNLQLDYLDLYLVHWPLELEKGADVRNLKDEQLLGYNSDREANCWKVYTTDIIKTDLALFILISLDREMGILMLQSSF